MLELEAVDTYYGSVQALHEVTMTIEEGEIVTLIGSNGAGKTTTLRTISGLNRPARGKIRLRDEPSLGLAPILVDTIFEVIREINKEGTTILLIEQNASKALQVANRGYVLETGQIVKEGSAKELLESPDVQRAYLGI